MRKTLDKVINYVASFFYPLLLAIPTSPIVDWTEKYIFKDWEFVKYLIVLIVIDTAMSWTYHIIHKDFSSKGFGMIFIKLLIYASLLIVAHVLGSYTIDGQQSNTFTWFRSLMCTALLVREAISIIENVGKINPELVPLWVRKYLKDFDENGFVRKPQQSA